MTEWGEDLHKPIRPIDRTESERVQLPGIEADKKVREKRQMDIKEKKAHSEEMAASSFTAFLQKVFRFFSDEDEEYVTDEEVFALDIMSIKKLLLRLAEKDESQNIHYALELSNIWEKLLFQLEQLESCKISTTILITTVRNFADSVNNYPKSSEHRLGYYLSEHAGKDWLPFPFMEILSTLHKDHLKEQEKSQLAEWIRMLESALKNH